MNKKIGSLSNEDIQDIYRQDYAHSRDGEIKENFGIVAVLDVLGWKNRSSEKSIKEYASLINRLRWRMYDTYKRCTADKNEQPNFNIVTLSDTIAILTNGSSPYCEFNIFNHISEFIADALERGFMFRGAISRGSYFTNILDNIFVGQSFYEAAKYAEKTKWSGVFITDSLSSALLENNSLQDLKQLNIIQYKDIPFSCEVPCKDKLVIVPERRKKILLPSKEVVELDYISLYKKYMDNEVEKFNNTKAFFEYVKKTFWKD